MNELKDFFKSIFDSSTERIKNPFVGTYVISFLIYNWRPIFLLLFSNTSIETKIYVINLKYCDSHTFLVPLAIAGFYIIVLPYINLLIDKILSFPNSIKEKRSKESILENLKHKKSEAKYEREIAEERAGTSEISELKNQIERLNLENSKLSDQNKESFDRYNKSLEQAKNKEKDFTAKISQIENEYENLSLEFSNYKSENLPQKVKDSLSKLTSAESAYFRQYGDFKTRKTKSVTVNRSSLTKFLELGLLQNSTKKGSEFELTEQGIMAYEFIIKLN